MNVQLWTAKSYQNHSNNAQIYPYFTTNTYSYSKSTGFTFTECTGKYVQRDMQRQGQGRRRITESTSSPAASSTDKMMFHFNHGNSKSCLLLRLSWFVTSNLGLQTSLSRISTDPSEHSKCPSEGSRRSVQEIFHLLRPSLDPIKQQDLPSKQELLLPVSATDQATDCSLTSELLDPMHGFVQSILRHQNTPGTGQNARLFSRETYMTIREPDYQSARVPQIQRLS